MLEALEKFLSKIAGGDSTQKTIRELTPVVEEINQIAESYQSLTDDELKAKTNEFRYRLRMGETLDEIMPEAFAVVKDTCRRLLGQSWSVRGQETTWNMVPYDVQILGAIVLHQGKIAEMATGEGKTLVATMPLYLNALEGKGAHLITVNDYLARRDCEWMGMIYKFLGLTVSAVYGDQEPEERKKAYQTDITYGTNNEFGFDYLRDNMATDVWSVVQRPLHYAIVDEVDSVLIDESRTPLIISGAVGAPRNVYKDLKPTVENLYRKQQDLVKRLLSEGKSLLETDEERAGITILRAQRGDPKNKELLALLTSEFWVKKLIERIQGQYEVNKTMSEIDQELYYTIDEKSHVLDITEKGRIFLSGGKEQDVATKIQQLDELDDAIARMAEQKKAARFYTQDTTTGQCNGLGFEGKLALVNIGGEVTDRELKALDSLDERLQAIAKEVENTPNVKKGDRAQVWRQYYKVAKKMDGGINALNDQARRALTKDADDVLKSFVDALDQVFDILRSQADVDGGKPVPRPQVDKRRELQAAFFETDHDGMPIGLKEAGRVALLAIMMGGDPLLLPVIADLEALLQTAAVEAGQEYFEFSDDGAVLKHIAEKGRIALLGGNPDLYILPDRSIVEERDRGIQQILDRTLNQSSYDYAGRVRAIEQMSEDVRELGIYLKNQPRERVFDFYDLDYEDNVTGEKRTKLTETARAWMADYAGETVDVVHQLDDDLKTQKFDIFHKDENLRGLAEAELDKLLGASYTETKQKIEQWQQSHNPNDYDSAFAMRADLDAALGAADQAASLSRRFEEVSRINHVLTNVFGALVNKDNADSEKRRLLRRYFDVGELDDEIKNTAGLPIRRLSSAGMERLIGSAVDRRQVAENLFDMADNFDVELDAIFELTDEGMPVALQPTVRTQLLDGLPFAGYNKELKAFRDEILKLSSKKVTSNKELQAVLPKDKTHLRNQGITLDDREMSQLIGKVHHPDQFIRDDEIEHWFQIHFNRRPRRELENQREKLWRDYQAVEERVQNISQLLRAYTLFQKDVDYVVKTPDESQMRRAGGGGGKAVMIVDQFTGRLMPGRRFSDGLHEALEAKEGVQVQAETQTLATITLQNFFRIYNKLSGMTGTAETEANEFWSTYGLDVVVIPTNKPVVRDDQQDVIYRTKAEKYEAIIDEATAMHEAGRPVLIGTVSVDVSQHLSNLFTRRGIPVANWLKKGDVSKELDSGKFHTVLNAKFHKQEAEIVAKAGNPGSITIATNMAGRGTDIKLSPGVIEAGGLHIIGSEKHEARRIDRQLRGRAGRQGDPGSSRFYLSLEDDLMRLFGSDRITSIMSRMGSMDEGERIEHSLITRSIERAQKKVEERNFEIRKHLLEYDNVLNEQRKIIYKRRQNLLGFARPEDFVESKVKRTLKEDNDKSTWDLDALLKMLTDFFRTEPDFTADTLERMDADGVRETVLEWVSGKLSQQQHFDDLQIRHRMWGFIDPNDILANLVRLKVDLHDAGTTDTSKWNLDGIRFELDRIFGELPEWLPEDAADLQSADEVLQNLINWSQELYRERQTAHRDGFQAILLRNIEFTDFLDIFTVALCLNYLPPNQSPLEWNVDEFLEALKHVFDETPELGANEIRNIRFQVIIERVQEWIRSLGIAPEMQDMFRHRIFGIIRPVDFAAAAVRSALLEEDPSALRTVPEKAATQIQQQLGFEPEINIEDKSESPLGQLLSQARRNYRSIAEANLEAYDAILLAAADNIELIEAALHAVGDMVVANHSQNDEAQKELASLISYLFFATTEVKIPDTRNDASLATFKEELVAWGHSHYKVYAEQRQRLEEERLSSEIVYDSVLDAIDETIYNMISNILGENESLLPDDVRRLESECRLVLRQSPNLADESDEAMSPSVVMDDVSDWAQKLYEQRVREIGKSRATQFERFYILQKIDTNWRQHLHGIDNLREGIGLRGYAQKDPLLEYKREAFRMFESMIENTNRETVSTLFRVFDIGGELEEQKMRQSEPSSFTTSHSQIALFQQSGAKKQQHPAGGQPQQQGTQTVTKPVVKTSQVGRNDPCPCGSGKKYKKCCGRNE